MNKFSFQKIKEASKIPLADSEAGNL